MSAPDLMLWNCREEWCGHLGQIEGNFDECHRDAALYMLHLGDDVGMAVSSEGWSFSYGIRRASVYPVDSWQASWAIRLLSDWSLVLWIDVVRSLSA